MNGHIAVVCKALECLCELTAGLQYRLAMLHDPSMAHTDPVTNIVAYLAATQQQPGSSSEELATLLSDLEDTNSEKMKQLQADQLRVDQYCHLMIKHCITILVDLLNKELVGDHSTCNVTALLCCILRLLRSTVELLRKAFFYHQKSDDDANELQNSVQVFKCACYNAWCHLDAFHDNYGIHGLSKL